MNFEKFQLDYGKIKRENHIGLTLYAKALSFSQINPQSSSTIHLSHKIYIGNPGKAFI